MLRSALEDRGAIIHDSPLTGSATPCAETPRADVLLVAARALDGRVVSLIQQVGAQPSPYLIVLSETDKVVDRIVALELGADDFLRCDSDPPGVLARAKSLIRRGARRGAATRGAGAWDGIASEWMLNDRDRVLTSPTGSKCWLTKGDVELLNALTNEPAEVLSVGMTRYRRIS